MFQSFAYTILRFPIIELEEADCSERFSTPNDVVVSVSRHTALLAIDYDVSTTELTYHDHRSRGAHMRQGPAKNITPTQCIGRSPEFFG